MLSFAVRNLSDSPARIAIPPLEIAETDILTEPVDSHQSKRFRLTGRSLAEEAAGQISGICCVQKRHVAPWDQDAEKDRHNTNNSLQGKSEHRKNQTKPLLSSERSRLKINHWRNENRDNQQDDTRNKCDSKHPVQCANV
jgi:hypothetical protein